MAFGRILSAFGKLGIVALIAVAFAFGLLTTIYVSLRSPNIQVPDVAGKTYFDGEKALAKAGLDIRERAKRYKPDVPPGVIIDQSPRAGETVKEGQTIAVVVSRAPKEGEQPPDEAVAEERREERGTEGLDENRNTNANRRKPSNRNTNGGANANSNSSLNANRVEGSRNANAANANNRNFNGTLNTNARRTLNTNTNARNVNSGVRAPTTTTPARPASNANRRPPTP